MKVARKCVSLKLRWKLLLGLRAVRGTLKTIYVDKKKMVAVLILADDAQRNFRRQRIFRDRTNPLDFLYDTKASFGQKQDSSRNVYILILKCTR